MYKYLMLATVSILAACQPASETPAVEEPAANIAAETSVSTETNTALATVLDNQTD